MRRVIVTGGAGFIGSHVVDRFVAAGDEVHVIDNLSSGKRENLPEGVTLHELDIRDSKAAELIEELKPELLVHLAAQISVRISMEDPGTDTDINVKGLVNLLSPMREGHKPFVVFISTGGAIYGEQDSFPADESHRIAPNCVYGLAKRVGEMYLELWNREFGLEFCALRLSNVYGPRQNPHGEAGVVAIFSEKIIAGETPRINGAGEQTRDFVFVEDVAAAVEAVCRDKISGVYNIGTGVETSVNQLYKLIAGSLDFDREAEHGPAKIGEQMRSVISPGKASETFGWKPTRPIEAGIKETTSWFASEK